MWPVVVLLVLALPFGVLLSRSGVAGADRYRDTGAGGGLSLVRIAAVTVVLALLWGGSAWLTGPRPALAALVWTAGAAVVLAQVDLAVHRLPDRVVYPAASVVAAAYLVDAVALGTWDELVRALLAGAAAFAGGVVAAAISPEGMGFGDVKLLGLLGLLLGWFGWPVVAAGVLLGLVVGALVALALVVTRRAGWRTSVALGPSLLTGAALALALTGPGVAS